MIRMAVELPKSAYIRDLKKLVAERMNVDPTNVCTQKKFILTVASIRRNLLKEVL